MTQDQEIREAIEYFNKTSTPIDDHKHLGILQDLANRYLSCSSMMPEKKELESVPVYSENGDMISEHLYEDNIAHNSAIDDATFSLMKKCEGISNIIYEEIIVASGDGQVKPSQYVQNCSSAIQSYLTKGE